MPYNPAVGYVPPNFRPDTGLMSLLMAVQDRRRQEAMEKQSLETMLGGSGRTQFNPAMGDSWAAPGAPEGPEEGTGEGQADETMKRHAKLADALRATNAIEFGYNPDFLKTQGLAQLRGLRDRARLEQVMEEQRLRHMETQLNIENAMAGRDLQRQQFQNVVAQQQGQRDFLRAFTDLRRPSVPPPGHVGPPAPGLPAEEAFDRALAESKAALPPATIDDLRRGLVPQQRWNLGPNDVRVINGRTVYASSPSSWTELGQGKTVATPTEQAPELYSDDPNVLATWLQSLSPEDRDQAMKTRAAWNRARGAEQNPILEAASQILRERLGERPGSNGGRWPTKPAAIPAPTKPTPKAAAVPTAPIVPGQLGEYEGWIVEMGPDGQIRYIRPKP